MKKIYILTILAIGLLMVGQVQASLLPSTYTSGFQHLSEVNKQWFVHDGDKPMDNMRFENDKQRIRYHLLSVIEILKNKEKGNLSPEQFAKRNALLDELTVYALEMNFPINSYHSARQPYFIDEFDNYCAVGYMIKVSGNEKVAREIQKTQNYAYLSEIKHNALPKWASEHGFDLNELAWIQPTYAPENNYQSIGEGTDEEVKAMTTYQGDVYFIGDFSEVDGEPCNGIGKYSNGTAECVLNGLEGTLNSVTVWAGVVWVSGAIMHNGVSYPLASYENGQWQYHMVDNLTNVVGLEVLFYYGYDFYVAIQNGNESELWMRTSNNTWIHKATVNGTVNASAYHNNKGIFAGDFNQVIIHYGAGNTQTLATNNMVSVENIGGVWQAEAWTAYTGNLPSVINVVKSVGEVLYIGGDGNSESSVVLTRYLNDSFQTLVERPDLANENYSLRDLAITDNATLVMAGDLGMSLINYPLMTYGQHLYEYDIASGYMSPIALFNQPANCVAHLYGEIIIGGEFTDNVGSPMNHLAKSSSPTGIERLENEMTFSLYPNPVADVLQVDFNEPQNGELRVTDISGRVLLSESMMGKNRITLNVSHLASQVAFVSVVDNGKTVKTERLVIQ